MNDETIWEQFLKEYLDNVKRELPESFRAQQLKAGGMDASLVIKFETMFLKKPFFKALKEAQLK